MKSSKNILAVALLSLVALWGCSQQSDEETADEGPEQTEDELILRRGNVDQAAIVESTTMMLAPGPTDSNNDPYNQEDPFAIRATARFKAVYLQRLGMFDGQDGQQNWTDAQKDAWATRMATANYQVIDTSKPCGDFNDPHTYLEIERARLTGRAHTTCGGRQPNEDALDVTVNFLIRGPSATDQDENALHDGVEQATQKSVPTFPYLAELNGL